MEITDSPHRPGTPEHDQWVRTTFIPGVGRERWEADRAKYGAASIGANITFVLDSDDDRELWPDSKFVSASGYAPQGNSWHAAAAAAKQLAGGFKQLAGTFSDFKSAFMQAFGFSDEEIKRSQDRDRRDRQDAMWIDVPEWMWNTMDDHHRASLGKVRIWSNRHGTYLAYYDHGKFLPEHGPPRPDNRAERRNRVLPPLRPQRVCPRHGGPADRCRPCQRSNHARR